MKSSLSTLGGSGSSRGRSSLKASCAARWDTAPALKESGIWAAGRTRPEDVAQMEAGQGGWWADGGDGEVPESWSRKASALGSGPECRVRGSHPKAPPRRDTSPLQDLQKLSGASRNL